MGPIPTSRWHPKLPCTDGRRSRVLESVSTVALLLLVAASMANLVRWVRTPPDEDRWAKAGGACVLAKQRLDEQTVQLEILDGRKRPAFVVTDRGADAELIDLTGDGHPEAIISQWGGGAHGPMRYYVFSLDAAPRCLLAYDKRNIEDVDDFEPQDLDGDGVLEIVSWYDGFAYWNASYAGSARIPVVLGYRNGRYEEVTGQHRRWLQSRHAAAWSQLSARLQRSAGAPLKGDDFHAVVQYYALSLRLYPQPEARRHTLRLLPAQDRPAFRRAQALIERTLAQRARRYAYPPAPEMTR